MSEIDQISKQFYQMGVLEIISILFVYLFMGIGDGFITSMSSIFLVFSVGDIYAGYCFSRKRHWHYCYLSCILTIPLVVLGSTLYMQGIRSLRENKPEWIKTKGLEYQSQRK